MTTRTPNTFIVGAGPVAAALAGAMRLGGVPVLGLWARKAAAARAAAAVSGVASYSAAPPDILLESDVVLLAVRDSAIAEVASMLVATGLITSRHVMLHCSGAFSAEEAFAPVVGKLGGVGTLHPLRAITDARAAMREMKGTVFGIEGNEQGRARAVDLARAIGGVPLLLTGSQMAAYHAAAAVASNYLVALLDAATAILAQVGVREGEAVNALLPLMRGSLDNVAERGLAAGLTGPIRRGDRATIERHLQALVGAGELDELYRVLGQRTVAVARRLDDVDAAALDAISALLGSSTPEPTKSDQGETVNQGQGQSDIESHAYRA